MTVLDHKISRVNQVSYIWTNAHQAHITEWDPLQHGWVKEDKTDNLIPKWFEEERIPNNLFHEVPEIVDGNHSENDNSEDEDSGSDSDISSGNEIDYLSECDDSDC